MPYDYKKEYREFYLPPKKPHLITIPRMNFVAVHGKGDPNAPGGAYQEAMGVLYGIAFTIKMSYKDSHKMDGYFEYAVPPLEGLWHQKGVDGVDYDDQLRIYKTYHRKKGQDIFGPTKNSKKGGNRNVPIPHWLAEEFRTYCSRLYGLTPDDRVFYMTCTALNKELTRCTQLTYLPDIRVHDLRHSHVSLCIELGYSIVLVAKRIGDTVPVVMRTYAHLYPNKQQELVSRLETLSTSSSSKDESDLMPLV